MEPTYQVIGGDGKTYGPVTLQELSSWINDGRIGPETNVSRSDHGGWFPAAQYSEFSFVSQPSTAAIATAVPAATAAPVARAAAVGKTTVVEADPRAKKGASWFYWIAALSLINSLAALAGSDWGFFIGLGITRVFDAVGASMGGIGKAVVLVLDLLAVGAFALFGFFGSKNHLWAFIVGMLLYALDGLIYVFASEWMAVGFHALGLFGMFGGLQACLEVRKLRR